MGTADVAAADLLRRAVDDGTIPGAVLAAGWGPDTEALVAVGAAETGERDRPMVVDTVFDLASLTKVVATLPVVLDLVATGQLALGDRAADLLPELGPGKDGVTVEHLLTHTAGLPSHRQHWRLGLPATELRARLLGEPLEASPGGRVLYSDIGFLLLGWIAESVTGRRLDDLVAEKVTAPLDMPRTAYGPRSDQEIAATERREDGQLCVGTVHDETAAALAAPAGHAGLFAPAGDLARYLAAWTATGDDWLPNELRLRATSDQTRGLDGHRGLGWVARHDAHDQLGEAWPPSAAFHSGFTGTSLALDLPSGRWVVLLTNDVHYGRQRGLINPLRRALHTALAP